MKTKLLPLGWWQSPTVLLSSQQIFQAWNHRVVRTWKHWKSSSSDYFSAIIIIKIIKCHNNNQYFDDLRSMVELLWRMITINNVIFWNQHKTIKVFKIKTIIIIIISLVSPEKQSWVVMKARKQKPRHRGRTVRHQHTILQDSFGFLIIIFLVFFFVGLMSDHCLALSLCKSVPLLNF